jgi:hypothetical protein
VHLADFRVFAVIRKVELTEVHPGLAGHDDRQSPVILEPVYCFGIEALQRQLQTMGLAERKLLLLEIAAVATQLPELLEQAPLIHRGRS